MLELVVERTTTQTSVPNLVTLDPFCRTMTPVPGRYYTLDDGRLYLCINATERGIYWFIDAETAPLTVRDWHQLQAEPITEMLITSVRPGGGE